MSLQSHGRIWWQKKAKKLNLDDWQELERKYHPETFQVDADMSKDIYNRKELAEGAGKEPVGQKQIFDNLFRTGHP